MRDLDEACFVTTAMHASISFSKGCRCLSGTSIGVTSAVCATGHKRRGRRGLQYVTNASSSGDVETLPGPRNAFAPGQESDTRKALFNRISPVYDEVSGNQCCQ
jgi:hypothetical protein